MNSSGVRRRFGASRRSLYSYLAVAVAARVAAAPLTAASIRRQSSDFKQQCSRNSLLVH